MAELHFEKKKPHQAASHGSHAEQAEIKDPYIHIVIDDPSVQAALERRRAAVIKELEHTPGRQPGPDNPSGPGTSLREVLMRMNKVRSDAEKVVRKFALILFAIIGGGFIASLTLNALGLIGKAYVIASFVLFFWFIVGVRFIGEEYVRRRLREDVLS